jgi:bifunctional non-homologous end joining protein LigD
MPLQTYRQKRNFSLTPEPKGAPRAKHKSGLQFVIQKHDASRLHYDFRLELDGTLKSWAVPKGPSLDPARKALAVQVEDHPLEYGNFEGVIPEGQYGGGTVLVWDRGTWEPVGNPRDGFAAGKLHFVLHGQKLKGEWALVRMHGGTGGDGKNWLLMKVADQYASKTRDILNDAASVKSKRSMNQIAGDRDDVWSGEAKQTSKLSGAARSAMPEKLSPQLAVLAEHPPQGDQWIHEIKFDGYRLVCFIKAAKVTLLTRNGLDWTHRFPEIAKALARLKVDSAIIDGEAVVLDKEGRSDFQALQAMFKGKSEATAVLYAFDLPFCDGLDLREAPLLQRKKRLEELLGNGDLAPRVNFSDHVKGSGDKVISKACRMGLEGIISKRADAPYVSRRDPSWLKSKCGNRQEFVIIGYTDPEGSRQGFGSLLLGYHDEKKRLVYGGRVGTGFGDQQLRRLHGQLQEIGQDAPPTDIAPPRREQRHAHWVHPTLVAEVRFTGWTRDGVLRHPAFIALRSDKPAAQIVREKPLQPRKLAALSANQSHRHPTAKNGGRPSAPKNVDQAKQFAGVNLSHPDKQLYPDVAVTKRDLAEYYQAVSEWMLPRVVDRPLALVRCPNGQAGKCFFQRNWNETMPSAVGKVDVGKAQTKEQHVAIRDLAGVISLVQIGVLEIHTWNCRGDDIERPDQLVFDLDPGPDLPWKRVIEAVQLLDRILRSLKLPTFLKTTGGKGFHVTIPIEPDVQWDAAKSFCQTIAQALVQKSNLFVANMRKDLRGGKVYIDYNRNDRTATAVAPYSTRARAGAAVSMPIAWRELGKMKSADQFTVKSSLAYLAKRRMDPWRDFEKSRVNIRRILQAPGL